jgi:hypothetical protein
MKTKRLVCNDCGCRFEIKDTKEPVSQKAGSVKAGKSKTGPAPLSCPECQSYNLTTA